MNYIQFILHIITVGSLLYILYGLDQVMTRLDQIQRTIPKKRIPKIKKNEKEKSTLFEQN